MEDGHFPRRSRSRSRRLNVPAVTGTRPQRRPSRSGRGIVLTATTIRLLPRLLPRLLRDLPRLQAPYYEHPPPPGTSGVHYLISSLSLEVGIGVRRHCGVPNHGVLSLRGSLPVLHHLYPTTFEGHRDAGVLLWGGGSSRPRPRVKSTSCSDDTHAEAATSHHDDDDDDKTLPPAVALTLRLVVSRPVAVVGAVPGVVLPARDASVLERAALVVVIVATAAPLVGDFLLFGEAVSTGGGR